MNLAENEHERGKTERAIAVLRDVLPEARAYGDRRRLSNMLLNLAGYLAAVDDVPGARDNAREVIRNLAPFEPDGLYVAFALEHLALALALGGDLERAAKLAARAEASRQENRFEREFTETTSHERLIALLHVRLAPEERERLLAEGAALSAEAAMALALADP